MPKVDLQIQTPYSDGRGSIADIMSMAKASGIDLLGITDHDTVDGIAEFLREAQQAGIEAIPGIEISVSEHGKVLHLLAFHIDCTNPELLAALTKQNETRQKEFTAFVPILNERLKEKGFLPIDQKEYGTMDTTYFSIPGLVKYMVQHELIKDKEDGFALMLGMPKWDFPLNMQRAIDVVHAAGGVAVMSHPIAPRISLKKVSDEEAVWKSLINDFVHAGLDGLELSSTGQSKEENDMLREWASELGLFVTYGSDWHGTMDEVGESIKKYLPYYTGELSGINISDESFVELRKHL